MGTLILSLGCFSHAVMCLVYIYITIIASKVSRILKQYKAHYVSVFHQTLLELCPLKGFGGAIRSMEAE